VAFSFGHDNNNYGIMRSDDGHPPSSNRVPRAISVVCSEGRATWRIGA
jgi:hypothetical protein